MNANMDATVTLTSAGTGVLIIAGHSESVQAASIQAARGEVIARVSAAAQEVGRPLRLEITEPESHWRVEISPNGQVSNLPASPPAPTGSAAVAPTPDEAEEAEDEPKAGVSRVAARVGESGQPGGVDQGRPGLPEGVAVMMQRRSPVSRSGVSRQELSQGVAAPASSDQEAAGEVVSLASLMTVARPDGQGTGTGGGEMDQPVMPPSFPPASPSPARALVPPEAPAAVSSGDVPALRSNVGKGWRGRRGMLVAAGVGIVALAGAGVVAASVLSGGAQAPSQDSVAASSEVSEPADVVASSVSTGVLRAGGSSGLCQVEEAGVRCWGASLDAQTQAPAVITGVEGEVTKLAVGRGFGVAATADGGVWAWGVNDKGQLGLGDAPETGAAVKVGTLPAQAEQIVAGSEHACLTSAGEVWCFGSSRFGQVGGLVSDAPQGLTRIEGPQNVVSLGTSGYDTWASDAEGRVWAWGSNEWGQVDPDAPGGSSTPVLVAGGQ